jgi:hypothetical protein
MPSLDISVSITKITIVYIINTATVTSKISTNYSNSLLLSIKNSKSTFWPIRMLRHPAAGDLRMCSFWAGGISSFPFSRAREYRVLRRLTFPQLLCWYHLQINSQTNVLNNLVNHLYKSGKVTARCWAVTSAASCNANSLWDIVSCPAELGTRWCNCNCNCIY